MKIGAPMRVQYAMNEVEKDMFHVNCGPRLQGAHVADVLDMMASSDAYVADVEKWIAALPSHEPALVGACVRACRVMRGARHYNEFVAPLVLRAIQIPDDYDKTASYRPGAPVPYVKGGKSLLISDDHLWALNQLLSHYHGEGDKPNTREHALIGEVWVHAKEALK